MKLRNKKTGEIHEITEVMSLSKLEKRIVLYSETDKCNYKYSSLAELNEEWEDVSEEYWYIDWVPEIGTYHTRDVDSNNDKRHKEIGNYFETKEEAEKAVEKLKAFKRLKDKGFRFTLSPGVGSLDIIPDKFQIEINADMPANWFNCDAVQKDLDLLFGGEDD